MEQETPVKPVVIPHESLEPETLEEVLLDFIHREGTDYGHKMPTKEEKLAVVRKQLLSGSAFLVFDPQLESCTLMRKEEIKRLGEVDGI